MIPDDNKSEGGAVEYEQRRRKLAAELEALRQTVATRHAGANVAATPADEPRPQSAALAQPELVAGGPAQREPERVTAKPAQAEPEPIAARPVQAEPEPLAARPVQAPTDDKRVETNGNAAPAGLRVQDAMAAASRLAAAVRVGAALPDVPDAAGKPPARPMGSHPLSVEQSAAILPAAGPANRFSQTPASGPVIDYRLTAPIQRGPVNAAQSIPAPVGPAPRTRKGLLGAGFPVIIGTTALLGGVLLAVTWSRISGPAPTQKPTDSRYGSGPRADLGASKPGGGTAVGTARSPGGLIIEPVSVAPARSVAKEPPTVKESPAKPETNSHPTTPKPAKRHRQANARIVRPRSPIPAPAVVRPPAPAPAPPLQTATVTTRRVREARVAARTAGEPAPTTKHVVRRHASTVTTSDGATHYVVVDVSEDIPVGAPKPTTSSERQKPRHRRPAPKPSVRDAFSREAGRHPAPGWDEHDDKWMDRF